MSMGLLLWLQSRWDIRALNWFILNQIIASLREKCPNTELFLVRIFPHSEWIWRDISYLSVFTPSAGKYGPDITPYLDTFHRLHVIRNSNCFIMLKINSHRLFVRMICKFWYESLQSNVSNLRVSFFHVELLKRCSKSIIKIKTCKRFL